MKKTLLIIALAFLSPLTKAQETTIDLSMQPAYANEVYYKLDTQMQTDFVAASWDIAFLRNDNFNAAVRVNDGAGIKVYEVANTPAGYDTVDVTNTSSWTELINSDISWEDGAFMRGSATFGFGEYNPGNHHIEGTIIFVLEYSDGTYRKIIIEDYFGAYTFKYATWNGSAWSADTTETVANASNPNNRYNYYSLQDNQEVVAEPAETDWDFVFTRYTTFINPPGQNYVVTGVLHNPNVTVAQNEETGAADPNGLTYSEDINTIGYDWKNFAGSWNIDSNQKFYVKYEDNTVYRLYFTDFGGQSNGNVTFNYEDVTSILNIENVSNTVSFGMYPNPTQDKKVTIVYDVATTNSLENQIDIYDLNGKKVFAAQASQQQGFYNKTFDLSNLQDGVYVVNFVSGNNVVSKKLILK